MPVERFSENPLIRPSDVAPSRPDFEVACAFNCGAIRVGEEVVLLLRVAERPKAVPADRVVAPIFDDEVGGRLKLLSVRRDDPDFRAIDSRLFTYQGRTYLTSISHLRLARSRDGRRFAIEPKPALEAATPDEAFGVEDPRISFIDGRYWVNYTAVSDRGISTALAVTDDFHTFERRGLIFAPENRDVTVFPAKIGGRYAALHRPAPSVLGGRDIWLAYSPDLMHWGDHRLVCRRRAGQWDALRIGGGAVPVRTEAGWLAIYHGADASERYCLGALLLDLQDPSKVLARSAAPLMAPEAAEERQGFFGNVVFTAGAVTDGDELIIYYGASDEYMCAARVGIREVLDGLGPA
ncbi:MAG: glycoside hydrolase family 130 protein [Phycisphaerae bacterium]|nr:glycoside hydrolase family 130 protein [Phycisphaerae bacterium]